MFKKFLTSLIAVAILALSLPVIASAARTDALWDFPNGTNYYAPNGLIGGVDILLKGSNHYLNWGAVSGVNGYGIRDNSGVMEFKNSGGVWAGLGSGGGGGGSSGGTFSTTTSQTAGILINYPNNNTDIVTVGGTATSTAPFYFDPNALFAKIGGQLLVTGSTTLQNLTFGNATGTQATTTNFFSTNLFGTTGNLTNLTVTNAITGSVTGNAGSATILATGRTLAITGDLTYTSPSFNGSGNVTAAGTLATVNGNVGSFTNANITVNAKGLITAAANGTDNTASSTLLTDNNGFSGLNTFTDLKLVTRSTTTDATTTNTLFVGSSGAVSSAKLTVDGGGTAPLSVFSNGAEATPFFAVDSGSRALFNADVQIISPMSAEVTIQHRFTTRFDPLLNTGTQTSYPFFLQNTNSVNSSSTGIGFSVTNSNASVGSAIIFTRTGSNSQGQLELLAHTNATAGAALTPVLTLTDTGVASTTKLTSVTSTSTSATSTNFFATTASTSALTFGTATGNTITIPNLGIPAGQFAAYDATGKLIGTTTPAGGSSASSTLLTDNNGFSGLNTFTDLKLITRSTTTNATTTNLFATTASTSNFFGANLSTCNGTTNALSWTAGLFGCGTIAPPASAITGGQALTKTDDTNVTLTLGGSPNTSLLAATSLTLGWTGTLADSRVADNLTISGGTVDNSIIGGTTKAAGSFTNLLASASSTLQNFTALNSTSTNATTTSIAATTICFTGDTCRTTWPSGGSSASSTLLTDNNGFSGLNTFTDLKLVTRSTTTQATTTNLSVATLFRLGTTDGCATWASGILGTTGTACGSSSGGAAYPFQGAGNSTSTQTQFLGGLIASNSTSTNATTTSLAISSITSKLLKTDGNGVVTGATAGTDYLVNAITSLNGLTGASQTFATTSSNGGWGFSSATTIHTLNIPTASATNVLGLLSNTDWSTFNGKQAAGNYITALTGDVTATGPGSVAATLATVNANTGTFGSATQAPVITLNGKGLATAASNVTITPAIGSITGLGTGVATFLATPSSANLATAVTDETGTAGNLVFSGSPTFTGTTNFASLIASASSTIGGGTTGTGLTIFGGATTTGNLLVNGSTTLQNLTFVNATGTSATTTNFFATTASSTNLFSSLATIGTNSALVVNSLGNTGVGVSALFARLETKGTTTDATAFGEAVWDSSNALTFGVRNDGHVAIGATTTPYAVLSVNAPATTLPLFAIGSTTSNGGTGLVASISYQPYSSIAAGTSTPNAQFAYQASTSAAGLFNNEVDIASSTSATAADSHFRITQTGKIFAPQTLSSGSSQTSNWCADAAGQFIRDSAACLISALRFKKDVEPLTLGLNDLLKLRPVTYYKKDPLDATDSHMQMGFIADEVASTSPALNELLVTYSDGGTSGEVHGFRYDQFTALLTKSIQELNQKVEGTKRSVEENCQDILIGLLILGFAYQQWQIKKLKS